MGWTTDTLIARARLYAGEPTAAEGGMSDADVLLLADDEVQTYCFPRLLMAHEEYAVTYSDTTLTAGTAAYTIPSRAHLGRLRDVLFVDTSGNQRSLSLIDAEELGHAFGASTTASEPSGFYLQGKTVCLWPTPSVSSGTLRLKYTRKPATLVATSACALVSGVTPSGSNYNCSASTGVPSTWGSSETTDGADPNRTEEALFVDVSATSVNLGADTWVYVAASVTGLAVGMYISLDGESCVPHLPEPLLPWLGIRTAAAIMESRGDYQAQGSLLSRADGHEKRISEVIKPRVTGEPRVIVTRNSPYRLGGMTRGFRAGRLP